MNDAQAQYMDKNWNNYAFKHKFEYPTCITHLLKIETVNMLIYTPALDL